MGHFLGGIPVNSPIETLGQRCYIIERNEKKGSIFNMPDIIERFGTYIGNITPEHPDRSRALLLSA